MVILTLTPRTPTPSYVRCQPGTTEAQRKAQRQMALALAMAQLEKEVAEFARKWNIEPRKILVDLLSKDWSKHYNPFK